MNHHTLKYFRPAFLPLIVTIPLLTGCAGGVYYDTFRYDATCTDSDARHPDRGPVCEVRKTR
ncbi:hypothetical protein SAMN05443582_105240 [Phyllobacterium sp. OV277]|nr:hypothetical protein SAMN05443582_105240 [Phyllobacterium sp. OV277]